MITGIRGLCNGLGPCLFGVIFYFFDMNLDVAGKDESEPEAGKPDYSPVHDVSIQGFFSFIKQLYLFYFIFFLF